MQSPFLSSPPKIPPRPEGELIKKDNGKGTMSSKDAEEEITESDFDDDTIKITGSMVGSSKQKKLKKFDFVTEKGIKEEWIDLLDDDVVKKKGPITLMVYREDGSDEVITDFKASDLHLSEWREVMKACPNRKGAGIATPSPGTVCTTLQGIWCGVVVLSVSPPNEPKYTKKYNSSIQYGDLPVGTVLNEPVLCMILFNSFHIQYFVTLEDFKDFNNEMLYTCKKYSLDFTEDLALMIMLGRSVPFFLLNSFIEIFIEYRESISFQDNISQDVITVGSTMRIPLLYQGEYSQWSERFMNYLEEETNREAMINSIKNGEHPLPIVSQVLLAETAPNAPPTLKDPKFGQLKRKKTRKD
ncbi:hypothetical protein Tco_1252855 [Tanacetum coccineum]